MTVPLAGSISSTELKKVKGATSASTHGSKCDLFVHEVDGCDVASASHDEIEEGLAVDVDVVRRDGLGRHRVRAIAA